MFLSSLFCIMTALRGVKMAIFKTRIKEMRARHNLTQQELADLVNVMRETSPSGRLKIQSIFKAGHGYCPGTGNNCGRTI